MENLFDIRDRVVVITGGLGILGSCLSRYLAEQGAKVVILGRHAEKGEAFAAELTKAGGDVLFLLTDVLKRELLEQNLDDVL